MSESQPFILLVEDEEIDIRILKKACAKIEPSIHLDIVNNGEDALKFLNKRDEYASKPDIDLILLDMNMPRMNGKELLVELKRDPKLRNKIVVMLTSSDDSRDIETCYNLGANAYIVKPVSSSALSEYLQTTFKFWFKVATLPKSSE